MIGCVNTASVGSLASTPVADSSSICCWYLAENSVEIRFGAPSLTGWRAHSSCASTLMRISAASCWRPNFSAATSAIERRRGGSGGGGALTAGGGGGGGSTSVASSISPSSRSAALPPSSSWSSLWTVMGSSRGCDPSVKGDSMPSCDRAAGTALSSRTSGSMPLLPISTSVTSVLLRTGVGVSESSSIRSSVRRRARRSSLPPNAESRSWLARLPSMDGWFRSLTEVSGFGEPSGETLGVVRDEPAAVAITDDVGVVSGDNLMGRVSIVALIRAAGMASLRSLMASMGRMARRASSSLGTTALLLVEYMSLNSSPRSQTNRLEDCSLTLFSISCLDSPAAGGSTGISSKVMTASRTGLTAYRN